MARQQIRLKVISEPDPQKRVIINVLVTGTNASAPDICCGGCGAPLITGMAAVTFFNVVFRCSACGAFNDLTSESVVSALGAGIPTKKLSVTTD
jgi:hypothetical protein